MDLLQETTKLLAECKERRKSVAENAGIGFEWLAKFSAGKIPDPGVCKVQKLYNYLKSQ